MSHIIAIPAGIVMKFVRIVALIDKHFGMSQYFLLQYADSLRPFCLNGAFDILTRNLTYIYFYP